MPEITENRLRSMGDVLAENLLDRIGQTLAEMNAYGDEDRSGASHGLLSYGLEQTAQYYLKEVPALRGLNCAHMAAFGGIGSMLFGLETVDPDDEGQSSHVQDALTIAQVYMDAPNRSAIRHLFMAVAVVAHRATNQARVAEGKQEGDTQSPCQQ